MKFGELLQYNQSNIFLQKSCDQLADVCNIEGIGQYLFHAKPFKCK